MQIRPTSSGHLTSNQVQSDSVSFFATFSSPIFECFGTNFRVHCLWHCQPFIGPTLSANIHTIRTIKRHDNRQECLV